MGRDDFFADGQAEAGPSGAVFRFAALDKLIEYHLRFLRRKPNALVDNGKGNSGRWILRSLSPLTWERGCRKGDVHLGPVQSELNRIGEQIANDLSQAKFIAMDEGWDVWGLKSEGEAFGFQQGIELVRHRLHDGRQVDAGVLVHHSSGLQF